jgi:hypothetical protein
MEGGISITGLTISGVACTAIGGMVGAWIRARYGQTRITPQPLDVRSVGQGVAEKTCDDRHRTLDNQVENLYARTIALEKEQATYAESLKSVRTAVTSMDGKLDILIRRRG